MKLFFDTETNGMVDWKKPPEHPSQPRMVQLAVVLTPDDCSKLISSASILIRPEGWNIPQEIADKSHHITTEYASAHGVPVACALSAFCHFSGVATELIAFNADFDKTVLLHELSRIKKVNLFNTAKLVCEMRAMTPICKLPKPPGRRRGGEDEFKWPSLTEAYEFCTGKRFEGAHDAASDVIATMVVHKWRINQPTKKGS